MRGSLLAILTAVLLGAIPREAKAVAHVKTNNIYALSLPGNALTAQAGEQIRYTVYGRQSMSAFNLTGMRVVLFQHDAFDYYPLGTITGVVQVATNGQVQFVWTNAVAGAYVLTSAVYQVSGGAYVSPIALDNLTVTNGTGSGGDGCPPVTVNITNGVKTTSASDIISDTLDDARLSPNVSLLGQSIDSNEINWATMPAASGGGGGGVTNVGYGLQGNGTNTPLELVGGTSQTGTFYGDLHGTADNANTLNGQTALEIATGSLVIVSSPSVEIMTTAGSGAATNQPVVRGSVVPYLASNNTFAAVQTFTSGSNTVITLGTSQGQDTTINPAQATFANTVSVSAGADYSYGFKLTLADTRGSGAAAGAAFSVGALNYGNNPHWALSTDIMLDGNPNFVFGTNLPTGTLTLKGVYHSTSSYGLFVVTGTRGNSYASYWMPLAVNVSDNSIWLNEAQGAGVGNRFNTGIKGTNGLPAFIVSNATKAATFYGVVNVVSNDVTTRGYRYPACLGVYTNVNQASLTAFGNCDYYFDSGSNYYIHSVNGTWSQKP